MPYDVKVFVYIFSNDCLINRMKIEKMYIKNMNNGGHKIAVNTVEETRLPVLVLKSVLEW